MRSLAFLSLILFVAGSMTAQAGGSASLTGAWVGEMRQIDPDRETRYPMTLVLKGKTGTTSYPTLNCSGTLTKVAELKNGYAIYQEKIANEAGASCIDGVVTVTTDAGKLLLGWFATFEGAPSLASATLSKEGS